MPSEIAGLPDLHGYLKSGNLVVPLSFPYIELPQKRPSFLAREKTARVIEIGKAAVTGEQATRAGKIARALPPDKNPTLSR